MTTAEKNEVAELRDLVAKSRPIYKDLTVASNMLAALGSKLKTFDTNFTILLNAQEALERRTRDAEANLARVEREAKSRLQSIEKGHRSLIDSLTQKEAALDKMKFDIESRERATSAARQEAELLKERYEQKLASLSEVSKKK